MYASKCMWTVYQCLNEVLNDLLYFNISSNDKKNALIHRKIKSVYPFQIYKTIKTLFSLHSKKKIKEKNNEKGSNSHSAFTTKIIKFLHRKIWPFFLLLSFCSPFSFKLNSCVLSFFKIAFGHQHHFKQRSN